MLCQEQALAMSTCLFLSTVNFSHWEKANNWIDYRNTDGKRVFKVCYCFLRPETIPSIIATDAKKEHKSRTGRTRMEASISSMFLIVLVGLHQLTHWISFFRRINKFMSLFILVAVLFIFFYCFNFILCILVILFLLFITDQSHIPFAIVLGIR